MKTLSPSDVKALREALLASRKSSLFYYVKDYAAQVDKALAIIDAPEAAQPYKSEKLPYTNKELESVCDALRNAMFINEKGPPLENSMQENQEGLQSALSTMLKIQGRLWQPNIDELQARYLPAQPPVDFVMVPREPTEEMLDATRTGHGEPILLAHQYKAMLAAAPQPSGAMKGAESWAVLEAGNIFECSTLDKTKDALEDLAKRIQQDAIASQQPAPSQCETNPQQCFEHPETCLKADPAPDGDAHDCANKIDTMLRMNRHIAGSDPLWEMTKLIESFATATREGALEDAACISDEYITALDISGRIRSLAKRGG